MRLIAWWQSRNSFERLALAAYVVIAVIAGFLNWGWLSLGALESVGLCYFKNVWGFRCPGCGMGHALIYAWQGQLGNSIAAHPFGLLFLASWTFYLGRVLFDRR